MTSQSGAITPKLGGAYTPEIDSSPMLQRSRSTQYGSPLWQLTQLLDGADANQ